MEFNFDEWAALYRADEQAFEARRKEVIGQLLASVPEERRRRLEGLQFIIDMERRRAKTPLAACVRINVMMWQKFAELRDVLNGLPSAPEAAVPAHSAQVLPLRRRRTDRAS